MAAVETFDVPDPAAILATVAAAPSQCHTALGHTHFIRSSINIQTWRALGTIASGEVISADSY